MQKIGVIGLGRLGGALVRGLDRVGYGAEIYGQNRTEAKALQLQQEAPSLRLCGASAEIFAGCDPVFLWTGRPEAQALLAANAGAIAASSPLIVSCTLNVPLARYTGRWAECYPNVNMPTGRGVTIINYAPALSAGDRETIASILNAVGTVYEVPAAEMSYYSGLCSCGPALLATMLETMADGMAGHRGYERDFCRRLVRESMLGTLLLQELDGVDAAEVVRRVAHPGGPSEAGAVYLREKMPRFYARMWRRMKKW